MIVPHITAHQRTTMLALVEQPHGKRGTIFAWLKDAARTASVKGVRDQIKKRQTILDTKAHTLDLTRLSRNRVLQIAQVGRKYYASNIRRFSVDKQLTILVCLLQTLLAEVTDDLVEMVDVLIKAASSLTRKKNAMISSQRMAKRLISACVGSELSRRYCLTPRSPMLKFDESLFRLCRKPSSNSRWMIRCRLSNPTTTMCLPSLTRGIPIFAPFFHWLWRRYR